MADQPDPDPSDLTIQRISSRIVYQNSWMQLREDVIQRPDGSQGLYSYVEKPDFALIIPVDEDLKWVSTRESLKSRTCASASFPRPIWKR